MSNLEDESLRKLGIGTILNFLRKKYVGEKKLFIPLLIARIALAVLGMLPALYYKQIVDLIANFTGGEKTLILSQGISLLLIVVYLKVITNAFNRIADFFVIQQYLILSRKIYLEAFEYVHRHSYRFFSNNFTGSLIKKINKLVGAYDRITDIFVFDVSSIVFNSIVVLIIIGMQNIWLSGVFLVWLVIFIAIQYFLYKRNYPNEVEANIQDSKVSGVLSDTITNNYNIKTFASLHREYKYFDSVLLIWKSKNRARWSRAMVIRSITGLLMTILEFAIFYLAIKLWSGDLISLGVFVLLQTYMFKLFDQLWNIGNVFRHLYESFSSAAEMLEILNEPHEVVDHTHTTLQVQSGRMEFENITFHYADSKPIFQDLDLRIKPGEKVAIVGESGSGKTTLVKLLFRFFDIQGGKILIDDQDISQVTQESLRASVAMVPQDPILFHRSIRENIAYANPTASEEEIIAAAKMARCHEFILGLNKGYDTLVGERGIKLSGGERQRVAIARAILANTRILVLDEATSSLDSESEKLIQEAMDEVMRNKTVIVIAHRLSTIMKMDKIIVMETGKIIEKGSHKELLGKLGGTYKKLRDIQSGGFIE